MKNINEIMEICLLAGKIMLTSGAETYRVEDTMIRIAKAYSAREAGSYVTPTGIFLSVQGDSKEEDQTKFLRISERSIDLNKIVLVNELSRKISTGLISIEVAYNELINIDQQKHLYPTWLKVLAAAVASGFFSLMFGGTYGDFLPAVLAGGMGFIAFIYLHRIIRVKFVVEIIASFLIGTIALMLLFFGAGENLDKIIIGSVMPLVPGVLITNAVRDLMAGDLVSGLARGAEAFITAFAIGIGVAAVIALL